MNCNTCDEFSRCNKRSIDTLGCEGDVLLSDLVYRPSKPVLRLDDVFERLTALEDELRARFGIDVDYLIKMKTEDKVDFPSPNWTVTYSSDTGYEVRRNEIESRRRKD